MTTHRLKLSFLNQMLFLQLTEFNTRSNRTMDHISVITTLKPTEQNWVSNTRHRHQIVHKATQNPKAFTKPLHGQAIKTAQAENHNWVQKLSRFVFSYRTTPHSSSNILPAQLLFSQLVRATLPILNPKNKVINRCKEVKMNNAKSKRIARDYANERRHAKLSNQMGEKNL